MERRLLKNLDWMLIGLLIVLCLLGLLSVASATQFRLDDRTTWEYAVRQATWLVIALIMMVLSLTVDYRVFSRWTRSLYLFNVGLLIAVRLFGREALGAQRWLSLGPIDLQPSELAKLLLILTLAAHLSRKDGKVTEWRDLVLPVLHVAPLIVLVLTQPDLGTSLVFIAILGGMLYMAGVPGPRLAGIGLTGLAAGIGYIVAHLRWGLPLPLKEYQIQRLIVFANPESDPLGAGYHILQSKIAIGSGRFAGQGLFSGTQNQLNYLPEQHTDFIFAVIGEEWGLVGGLLMLTLFLLILQRGLHAAAEARDLYGSLLASGVVSMLGFHLLVNVGMTMGIMPVTGVPLPFVSYGGSSLLTNALAMGLLLNVYMRRHKILF